MLVLTRKKSESISIGNDVVITITQIGSGKVKLGIVAPDHIRIRRSELVRFETEPVDGSTEDSKASTDANEAVTEIVVAEESATECPVDFSTEYAAEIEDQMYCVLA
ncbi:carbon storage regulator [Schlesneria sp. T3-172]|uniref:carbon storage regulator n=1 Tax=Schlesneria sphaerica TaxID=3373610 RepID=UPI0037C846D4